MKGIVSFALLGVFALVVVMVFPVSSAADEDGGSDILPRQQIVTVT